MGNKQHDAVTYFVLALVVFGFGLWALIQGATVAGVVALMAGIGAAVFAWSQHVKANADRVSN